MPWPEQFPALIQSQSSLSSHAAIVVTCLSTSDQIFDTDTRRNMCLCNFHSASDTARHRFCSIENTRLDPTSSFPAVTKLRNWMNYCGRNSSELSCMSSAAGNQSIVPGFSESPQLCCEEGTRGLVDIISPSESARASHTAIFELYTSQNDMEPASRATFVKDIRSMVESFCNRFRCFSDR